MDALDHIDPDVDFETALETHSQQLDYEDRIAGGEFDPDVGQPDRDWEMGY